MCTLPFFSFMSYEFKFEETLSVLQLLQKQHVCVFFLGMLAFLENYILKKAHIFQYFTFFFPPFSLTPFIPSSNIIFCVLPSSMSSIFCICPLSFLSSNLCYFLVPYANSAHYRHICHKVIANGLFFIFKIELRSLETFWVCR